jgi:DNA-binding transcriptional LysR family regulator
MTVIAFGAGCSYRRTLEEWLVRSKVTPERVLEFGSYHAIVACVAAGSGIALLPHSVVHALHAEGEVSILPLPTQFSLQMPRRFLSGPENIVLLLSTLYVANWLRRTSAKHFAEVCAQCLWPQHGPRAPLLLTASWQKPARSRRPAIAMLRGRN